MSILIDIKRYFLLSGFWSKRTDFYRDLSRSLAQYELPKDFVEGELQISTSPRTADKNRARGLIYIRNLMDNGEPSLHEVLSAAMPKSDALALGVLKDSRDRPKSLTVLATAIEQQQELTKMVRSALSTPMILLPVGFSFSYLLATSTIPEFAKAAPPEIWNATNLLVKNSAEVVAQYGPYAAALVALGLLWLFAWALPNLTINTRYKMESSRGYERLAWLLVCPVQPIFAIYRDIQATRMLSNLATLLQANMLLSDALVNLSEGALPWMRRHLLTVGSHLQDRPGDYVGAFSHGILSPFLLARMHTLVRLDGGGKFDTVLIELGSVGQIENREAVKKNALRANAFLLVLVLGVILFFYVGQQFIAQSIQDANSPSAVMKRNAQRNKQFSKTAPNNPPVATPPIR